jgi:pullulanase
MSGMKAIEHLLGKTYGAFCNEAQTTFRTYAIGAASVKLAIYEDSFVSYRKTYGMTPEGPDVWSLTLEGDYHGGLYTYLVERDGKIYEIVDPYAVSAGLNSTRGGIVNLALTNPPGFMPGKVFNGQNHTDFLLYELHLRDFTVDMDGGIQHKGKYLGLAESGTTYKGLPTGLDHLVDLGVTHVHLMPIADFGSVKDQGFPNYNWGYDPILFNVPEGSYATDPKSPVNRIMELKQLVSAIHAKGLRVVLDVVYNHTYDALTSAFVRMAPHVFYREKEGVLTNGSGVGCELNTEHPLVQSFIIQSLVYWMTEYQIDGFRFDLMGLYDRDCVRRIEKTLKAINPNVLLYGEPWVGGDSGLPANHQFLKGAQKNLQVALFNDDFRNAIKGDNDGTGQGLVQGNIKELEQARLGVVGSIEYSSKLSGFTANARESVNYVSSHDNLILRDKLERTITSFDKGLLMSANRLALAIVLTSFGLPFIQAGTELYRAKGHEHNSYNMGDGVNHIRWQNKAKYYGYFAYIRALIQFRKHWSVFTETDAKTIKDHVTFIEAEGLSYSITKDQYSYFFHHNCFNHTLVMEVNNPLDLFFFNDIYSVEGIHKKDKHSVFTMEAKSSLIYRQVNKKHKKT